MSPVRKYQVLLRREFWEFRSLWLTPLVAVGILLLATLFSLLHIGSGIHVSVSADAPVFEVRQVGAQTLVGLSTFFGIFAAVVTVVYLLDCLYGERKDRSILFWKSLPVSDAETVLAKLAVALLVMPLLVLVLALLLQPVAIAIASWSMPAIRAHVGGVIAGTIGAIPSVLGMGMVAMLWYLPIAAYLMLASVVARRAPLAHAVVPLVGAYLIDVIAFGGGHVMKFLLARALPWPVNGGSSPLRNGVLQPHIDWSGALLDPALWGGVVAAAAVILVVIRLRRYRDDS